MSTTTTASSRPLLGLSFNAAEAGDAERVSLALCSCSATCAPSHAFSQYSNSPLEHNRCLKNSKSLSESGWCRAGKLFLRHAAASLCPGYLLLCASSPHRRRVTRLDIRLIASEDVHISSIASGMRCAAAKEFVAEDHATVPTFYPV